MENKAINAVIVPAHHTEAVWNENYADYIPENGEFIIYDIDDNYSYIRIKLGNGTDAVGVLDFTDQYLQDMHEVLFKDTTHSEGSFLVKGSTGPEWLEISRAEGSKF